MGAYFRKEGRERREGLMGRERGGEIGGKGKGGEERRGEGVSSSFALRIEKDSQRLCICTS